MFLFCRNIHWLHWRALAFSVLDPNSTYRHRCKNAVDESSCCSIPTCELPKACGYSSLMTTSWCLLSQYFNYVRSDVNWQKLTLGQRWKHFFKAWEKSWEELHTVQDKQDYQLCDHLALAFYSGMSESGKHFQWQFNCWYKPAKCLDFGTVFSQISLPSKKCNS